MRDKDRDRQQGEERPLRAGTITKMVVQKKNANRISIFLDGTFAFGMHVDLVSSFMLSVGRMLSIEEQQQIADADQVFLAKTTALRYLAHRSRSEQEVRRRLRKSTYTEAIIEQVIARLYDLHYLDDEAYALSYVRARFANRGYGPQRIRNELRQRGIAQSHIEAALSAVLTTEDQLAVARTQAEKRWTRLASEPDPRKRRKKLMNYLIRRGFTFDTVRQITDELVR